MLAWIILLTILATVAGVVSFAGITSIGVALAHTLFAVFLSLLVLSIAVAALWRR